MTGVSTPVVKLWDGVLALPMIGTLDSARTQIVMETLLQRIDKWVQGDYTVSVGAEQRNISVKAAAGMAVHGPPTPRSAGQLKFGSILQVAEQPSPPTGTPFTMPSSHSSSPTTRESPHTICVEQAPPWAGQSKKDSL